MVSLIIEAVSWCSMLMLIGLETKVYIYESRWSVRFGVVYALVGDTVMLNLVLSVIDYYNWLVFCDIFLNMLYQANIMLEVVGGYLLFHCFDATSSTNSVLND